MHVKGTIRKIDDEKYVRGILARLTCQHEVPQTVPWKMGASNDYIADLLQEIVVIEIKIESVMAKFKVRQNCSQIDAASAANALYKTNLQRWLNRFGSFIQSKIF